jgi:hypothetical protein
LVYKQVYYRNARGRGVTAFACTRGKLSIIEQQECPGNISMKRKSEIGEAKYELLRETFCL